MWEILRFIKRYLVWWVAGMMVAGIVGGNLFDLGFLSAWIIPLTVLMVYPMMVTMQLRSIASLHDYRLQGITQAINFLFIPIIGFGLGWLFFPETPYLIFGLLLMALLPTSGMTISWTGFAGGNTQAAVRMTIIGLIAGVVLTPLYGWLFMGKLIPLPMLQIIKQIALIIVIPLVLGALTQFALRRWLGDKTFDASVKPKVPLLSQVGMLGVIFSAMALKAETIVQDPWFLGSLLVPILLFYLINYTAITLFARWWFPAADGIALVFGTVMRNLSIALAIALSVFGEHGTQMALLISLGYVIQIKSAALYMKLAGSHLFKSS